MSDWRNVLTRFASNADDHFDKLIHRFRQRTGRIKPVQIVPYRGFGNSEGIYVKGRVLENRNIALPEDNDTIWENMVSMYKRFETNEIPNVQVQIKLGANTDIVKTDSEGYFESNLTLTQPLPVSRAWHDLELTLLEPGLSKLGEVKAVGQILVAPPFSQFGIISDIDDTILVSQATNWLRMARLAFLGNARTRLPFPGVAAFYRALQTGSDSSLFNPIFYVSSSPWNLYDLLIDFCSVQGIPKGPLMLRDIGVSETQFLKSSHLAHKTIQIEHVLRMCRDLPFILIGDSGQHDPEIYRQVVKDYPGRIKTIYIREVTSESRRLEVQQVIEEVAALGTPMLLVKDTLEAASHAAEHGYIDAESLPDIRADKRADEAKPKDLDLFMDEL
jgi:phosphatidate phosphatase APP1